MTHRSTIYSRCPSCHKDGLVNATPGQYRCAVCNFDYATFAGDQAAREAWMLENLRLGGLHLLSVPYLHRVIMTLPPAESFARVRAFADAHGVALPKGGLPSVKLILALVFGFILLTIAIGALLAHVFG